MAYKYLLTACQQFLRWQMQKLIHITATKTLQIQGKKSDAFRQSLLDDFFSYDTEDESAKPISGNASHTSAVQEDPGNPSSGSPIETLEGTRNVEHAEVEITAPNLNNELSKIWAEISSLHHTLLTNVHQDTD